MEALLLASLQILRVANASGADNEKLGKRLLRLNTKRDTLLAALPDDLPQTAADNARWELVRYVNKITQRKIAAKI